jgi:hypothetical protein
MHHQDPSPFLFQIQEFILIFLTKKCLIPIIQIQVDVQAAKV